jgi:hypothetical protein
MSTQLDEIGKQLKESLGTDIAIIDKFGFVLYSSIRGYEKDTLISNNVLNFINERDSLSKELKSDSINSITISAENQLFVFSLGKKLILLCILKGYTGLEKLLPSIRKLLSILDMVHSELKLDEMADISIDKEIKEIETRIADLGKGRENKFEIFQKIVTHINQLH